MKAYKFFISLFLIIFTHGFCDRYDCELADGIAQAYSKELKRKYGFQTQGMGGRMTEDVISVILKFVSQEKVNIEQARRLLVNSIEGLKDKMNNNLKIRPFLHEFPSSYHVAEISISFNTNNKFTERPYLAVAGITEKGKVYYCYNDPNNPMLEDAHEETYEEAYTIVQKEKAKELLHALD